MDAPGSNIEHRDSTQAECDDMGKRLFENPSTEVECALLLTGRGVPDAAQEIPIASGSLDTARGGSSAVAAPTGRGKGSVVDHPGAHLRRSVRGPAAAAAPTGRGRGSGVLDTAELHLKSDDAYRKDEAFAGRE
eukprot:6391366-Alexandrium_andersonii.AAC.1